MISYLQAAPSCLLAAPFEQQFSTGFTAACSSSKHPVGEWEEHAAVTPMDATPPHSLASSGCYSSPGTVGIFRTGADALESSSHRPLLPLLSAPLLTPLTTGCRHTTTALVTRTC